MLKFNVFNQKLVRTDKNNPATDSVEYLEAQFIFNTDDWNGKTKSAIFTKGTSSYTVLLDSKGVCKVPFEVLQSNESSKLLGNTDKISVTLVGIYDNVRITTNELKINLNYSGYSEGQEPSEPTAEMYEQILTAYADAEAKCEETQEAFANTLGLYSNAIKGSVSGTTVTVDDVSSIEHELDVCVHSINLFDISKITPMEASSDYAYLSEVGSDYLVITTSNSYDGNGYCTISKKLKDVCPSLKVGKKYILSATTESNSTNIYLPTLQKSWIFGQAMTMTEEALNSSLTFYGLSAREGYGTGNCRISNIQVEIGDTATAYEPYIDPTNTIVTAGNETFTALSNGTVEGIKSTALAKGITTDAEGMTIDVEYNKDINVVLNKISDALGIEI
jgi:hypothetical protein